MIQSYFEYTLEHCSENIISAVCSLYATKSELLEAAGKGFNGNNNILGQGLLIFAAEDLIAENGYIVFSELSSDAKKLYVRCERKLKEMKQENRNYIDIDREKLFDVLVEINWLFSSKYTHVQRGESGLISLLTSPSVLRIGLRKGLKEVLYETALYQKDRSEQYETAQMTRYEFLPRLHPDPQVRDLFAQGYTYSNFKDLQEQARECSINRMALFYGLTATAAKAEQIRRML